MAAAIATTTPPASAKALHRTRVHTAVPQRRTPPPRRDPFMCSSSSTTSWQFRKSTLDRPAGGAVGPAGHRWSTTGRAARPLYLGPPLVRGPATGPEDHQGAV